MPVNWPVRVLVSRTCTQSTARCCKRTLAIKHAGRKFSYDAATGLIDLEDLKRRSRRETAAVLIQSPNFFGTVENVKAAAELAHAKGALLVYLFTEAVSLEFLRPRGRGIVAGELQSFAIPPSYRWSVRGHIAAKENLCARCPAAGRRNQRLARSSGLLPDPLHARTAYPPRESDLQHLHQPSSDCPDGDRFMTSTQARPARASRANLAKSHYLASRLKPRFSGPFFNEFVAQR